jgi:outer membrane protein assembly factor BamB
MRMDKLARVLGCAVAAAGLGHLPEGAAGRAIGQHVSRTPGEVIWRVAGKARGTPAADGRTVFFLTTDHAVVAIDQTTGAVRWRAATGEEGATTTGSSVVLSGSLVVVGDYNVVAFDRSTGGLRWRFTPADGYGPGIYLGRGTGALVYSGSPAGRLYAIDPERGAQVWATTIASDRKTTVFEPATEDGLTVASYTTFTTPPAGGVVGVDSATGRERWRTAFPKTRHAHLSTGGAGAPVFAGDVVVVASASGDVYAFDRETGAIRWSIPAEEPVRAQPTDPVPPDYRGMTRAGSTLVIGSLTGRIVGVDLGTRRRLWVSPVRIGSTGFKLSTDGAAVYVPHFGGTLVSVRASDGTERWRRGGGEEAYLSPPYASGGRLFVGSTEGFYCLRP